MQPVHLLPPTRFPVGLDCIFRLRGRPYSRWTFSLAPAARCARGVCIEGAWLRITQSQVLFPPVEPAPWYMPTYNEGRDDGHPSPRMLMFILFRAMEGDLGSKGFPEQFDHLCCTQSSRGFHAYGASARTPRLLGYN